MGRIQSSVAWWEKICSGVPLLADLYLRPYRRVLENEIKLAHIQSTDRVLNIGCGSIPFTAIYLKRLTGAQVWAMDIDQEAIEGANRYLKSIGMEGDITLYQGDGSQTIPLDFTVALVALQAHPKEGILRKLSAVSPASRLIFRLPREKYRHHYDTLPSNYQPTALAPQKMRTFDRSILLTPKGKRGD